MDPTWSERKERGEGERGRGGEDKGGEKGREHVHGVTLSRKGSRNLQDKGHRHRTGAPSQQCSFLFIYYLIFISRI